MPKIKEKYHRVASGKRKKKDSKINTIDVSSGKGIKALYDAKNKVVVAYLFDTNKWVMKDAKEWVKKNKSIEAHLIVVENRYIMGEMSRLLDEHKTEVLEEAVKRMQKH